MAGFEVNRQWLVLNLPVTASLSPPGSRLNIATREWRKALDSGKYASQNALARKLGISRVRVTQVLNLLRLSASTIDQFASLGDPLPSPIITERKLRPLVQLPEEVKERRIDQLLNRKLPKPKPMPA